jgi:multidrug transporter EmrE-like cation transporter
MVAIALAIVLFATAVDVLRWISLALVLGSIPVLTWTLMRAPRRDV